MAKESLNRIMKSRRDTKRLNILLFLLIGLAELLLMSLILYVSISSWVDEGSEPGPNFIGIYNVVAIDLMLLWVGVLLGYYTWAIYFYNINLGFTNEDWAEIRARKEQGETVYEPTENPHKEQTLGLPDGTIRGTLALSLAIGAISMLIASLNRDTTLPANAIFIDAFDFFKTAFLMMIAFYFGNKSLESLKGITGPKVPAEVVVPKVEVETVVLPPTVVAEQSELRRKLNNESQLEEHPIGERLEVFDDPKAKG